MDHLFGHSLRNPKVSTYQKRFNPCFDGSPFWTDILGFTILESAVSILVLMDHLFGVYIALVDTNGSVFQSLF